MNTIPPLLIAGYSLGVVLYGGYWLRLVLRRRTLTAQVAARQG